MNSLNTLTKPVLSFLLKYDELVSDVMFVYPEGIPVSLQVGMVTYPVKGNMHVESFVSRMLQTSCVGEELINWIFMQVFHMAKYQLDDITFTGFLKQHVPQYIDHWIETTFSEGFDDTGEIDLDYDMVTLLDNNVAIMAEVFVKLILLVRWKISQSNLPLNLVDIHVTARQHAIYIEAEHA